MDIEMMKPETLILEIVKSLVDHPEQVSISPLIGETVAVIEIHVADSDVGRALGKGGMYPEALRCIFSAIYSKAGKRLQLQVVEPRRR